MGRRGQVIVLLAIGIAVFLGFLGLVLDGGSAYLQQRNLQRGADLAALSGTWGYYNANYRGSDNYNNVAAALAAARSAVTNTLRSNGLGAATATVTFNSAAGAGVDTSGCQGATPTCPPGWEIRGVTVGLAQVLGNQLVQAVGAGQPTITATAAAQVSTNTGALAEAPLLLQNYTDVSSAVPRIGGYPACANGTDGLRYPMSPTDCRPSTRAPWPAQALNLEPRWQAPFAPAAPPFNTAPLTRFYLLNEPSGSATPASAAAEQLAVSGGLSELVGTCRPGCPGGDAGSAVRYAMTTPPSPDPVFPGAGDRVSRSGTGWAGQSCANPLNRASPLTPDNPRLMRLPITYAAMPGPSGVAGVGAFRVSETLMFCLESVQGSPGSYALSGYIVEEPSNASTLLDSGNPYFGRDVVVRLTQ